MRISLFVLAFSILCMTAGPLAAAERNDSYSSYGELSSNSGHWSEFGIMGGLSAMNKNDTAFRDTYVNIPVGASLTYGLNQTWALEGDFSWFVPVKQQVQLDDGVFADRKSPDVLTYQANAVARMYMEDNPWLPYVTAGMGGMSVLSSDKPDREPRLSKSVNMFATNFGVGTGYRMSELWSLKIDFREFVGFPSSSAQGLSRAGSADKIWMERGTVGLSRRF